MVLPANPKRLCLLTSSLHQINASCISPTFIFITKFLPYQITVKTTCSVHLCLTYFLKHTLSTPCVLATVLGTGDKVTNRTDKSLPTKRFPSSYKLFSRLQNPLGSFCCSWAAGLSIFSVYKERNKNYGWALCIIFIFPSLYLLTSCLRVRKNHGLSFH